MMYRLRLEDERLVLPAPVYRVRESSVSAHYLMRAGVEAQNVWDKVEEATFFDMDRQREGLIPIFAMMEGGAWEGEPVDPFRQDAASSAVAPLYEYHRAMGGRFYSTNPELKNKSLVRPSEAICRVWRSPQPQPILDDQARPAFTASGR